MKICILYKERKSYEMQQKIQKIVNNNVETRKHELTTLFHINLRTL